VVLRLASSVPILDRIWSTQPVQRIRAGRGLSPLRPICLHFIVFRPSPALRHRSLSFPYFLSGRLPRFGRSRFASCALRDSRTGSCFDRRKLARDRFLASRHGPERAGQDANGLEDVSGARFAREKTKSGSVLKRRAGLRSDLVCPKKLVGGDGVDRNRYNEK
jgi:hypothetical protein